MSKKRIKFKHYKTGEVLTIVGTLPIELNNPQSERYVVRSGMTIVDVIKSTVISIEETL
jgi:hypothetical protein